MDIGTADEIRFSTGMGELDRVLGGGAVKGSLVLVGGARVKNKNIEERYFWLRRWICNDTESGVVVVV